MTYFWHHDKHLAYFWYHDILFYMITSFWQTFWSKDEQFVIMTCVYIMTNIFTSGQTFWHHDVFLALWNIISVMTSVLTSWRVYDIMTNFWCNQLFDVINVCSTFWRTFWRHGRFLTWHTLDAMTHFLTSWCVLYVMIRFWCHWRDNIFLLHDN